MLVEREGGMETKRSGWHGTDVELLLRGKTAWILMCDSLCHFCLFLVLSVSLPVSLSEAWCDLSLCLSLCLSLSLETKTDPVCALCTLVQ